MAFETPTVVRDLDIAFPAKVAHLMPKWEDLPAEYQRRNTPSCRMVSRWFYAGGDLSSLMPRDGIDRAAAVRHIQCVLGSFEPRHEHKIAALGWLVDRWFEVSDAS